MCEHIAGIMRDLSKTKTELEDDMFFAVELAWQMLSKYYAEVTPMTGMFLISACIVNHFHM